jgi:hypothetical protein
VQINGPGRQNLRIQTGLHYPDRFARLADELGGKTLPRDAP